MSEMEQPSENPEPQYRRKRPPPLPPLPPGTGHLPLGRHLPPPAPRPEPAPVWLTATRLSLVLPVLLSAVAAELLVGWMTVSSDGIGRLLQFFMVAPALLLALFGSLASGAALAHWLATRIETTLDNLLFWALLLAFFLNAHVLYAHAGLLAKVRA